MIVNVKVSECHLLRPGLALRVELTPPDLAQTCSDNNVQYSDGTVPISGETAGPLGTYPSVHHFYFNSLISVTTDC